MEKPTFDPGLTNQYTGVLKRAINKDGNFNVKRSGQTWRDIHPYLALVNMPWYGFAGFVLAAYIVINLVFACVYMLIGIDNVKGTEAPTAALRFLNAFFFSAHTLTTVGYGNMWPSGAAANSVAAIEALFGLMLFAIATGLLFGRFSRPSARIGFSERMIVAPYGNKTSLQFRVVNRRSNNLINLQTRMMLMTVDFIGDRLQRRYVPLELERNEVLFLALTWTVVHPIEENSPLWGKTAADLERLQAEVLIMMSGFDDTFSQTVHTRYSYRYDEIKWDVKFAPAFEIGEQGDLIIELERVSQIETAVAAKALDPPQLT